MLRNSLKHRIVAVFLAVMIFNFNLVVLPDMGKCSCDHPHDRRITCHCSTSLKSSCEGKGATLSKRQCGLEKNHDFSIPAHEYPTILSFEDMDLDFSASILSMVVANAVSGIDLPPTERPPSTL